MDRIGRVLSRHDCIGIDTSIFIYYVEDILPYSDAAEMVFDELEYGKFAGVTSVITLMELLVKPISLSNPERVAEYEGLLRDYPHLTIAEITQTIARRAAQLRARYRLRPPDAMTLAAVVENGATAFITNDLALRRVREIEIIALNDYVESGQ